jgi:hypothetical protein
MRIMRHKSIVNKNAKRLTKRNSKEWIETKDNKIRTTALASANKASSRIKTSRAASSPRISRALSRALSSEEAKNRALSSRASANRASSSPEMSRVASHRSRFE